MAYDRYDDRDNRGYRGDRQRDDRSGGRDEERGFFDRAIDSVSNFFSDDDSGGRGNQGHGYNRAANNYDPNAFERGGGYSRSSYEPRTYDQNEGRQRGGSEHDRSGNGDRGAFFGGGQSTSYGRDRDEGDHRNQYGRGGGDYGSQGSSNQSRQSYDRGDMGNNRSYPSSYGQTGGGSYRDSQQQQSPSSSSSWNDRGGSQDRQSGGYQSQGSDQYRPMTGDYGRNSNEQDRHGSGLGSQNYSQQQYGSQDRFQDQGRSNWGGGSGGSSGSSAYGSSSSSNFGGGSSQSSMRSPHDQHYSSWRQRQIEDLDRDYDEYCREHQNRFENEFSGFRQTRQTKRQLLTQIREHAEVVDESGQHIGTVDKVRGDKVILTKNDPEAHGVHRSFTSSLLDRVEDNKVYLSGSKDSIRSRLTEEREDDQNRSQGGMLGGLFGGSGSDRDDRQTQQSSNQPSGQTLSPTSTTGSSATGSSNEGPHVLDKSFSGTYDDDSSTSRSTKK